jgi:endonuclease/exonuclease/phosphatase family metal-dependent hydrolase
MRSGNAGPVITSVVVAYALGTSLVAAAVLLVGDSTALGTILLFGPRWMLVYPWLLLVPLALVVSRQTVMVALFGTGVALFLAGGFEMPFRMPFRTPSRMSNAAIGGAEGAQPLRVVTYNTDGSRVLASRIASDVRAWNAEIILLQDCSQESADALLRTIVSRGGPAPYEMHRDVEFCLLSRIPLRGVVSKARLRGSRADGRAVRFAFDWNGTPVSMATVHLPSPRDALGAARHGDLSLLEESIATRYAASRATADWVREGAAGTALVVAGDFNLPAESPALRDHWGPLRNAFSEAAWGFGHTMFAGPHRARIDHVLVSDDVLVRKIEVLSGYPTEHQPVVANLGIVPAEK